MAGFGSKMKKRPPPDDDDDGDEDDGAATVQPRPGQPRRQEPEGEPEVFDEETADTEEEVGEPMASPRGMGGAPSGSAQAGDPDQAAYDRFVKNGLKLIYDKNGVESLMQSLEGDGNPVEGLANVIASVVSRLVASAQKAGAALPDDVILYGTGELIEAVADLSKESGGHAYTEEELRTVAKAVVEATKGGEQNQQPAPAGPPTRGMGAAPGGGAMPPPVA